MMPPKVRKYLVSALSGTPEVIGRLLQDLPDDDPRWDIRPESNRFSLREVVAHLADWEPINLDRLRRMRWEDNPSLPDIDESTLAVENDYSQSDPHGSLEWIRGGRQALMAEIETLAESEWSRTGVREGVGLLTIELFVTLVLAHDGYHSMQIAQWLTLTDDTQSAK